MTADHRAGAHLRIHTNGDEASEAAVEMIGRALTAHPRLDHRHTLQHCQMPDPALFRRIKALGICCNLFANHLFYWGDEHVAQTMGLSRAERRDACGTVLRLVTPFAIHSDAPVTPLAPLFTAWCSVMRQTASGRVLGEGERIGVADALHAVTLGAAYTLKRNTLIGSIEVGKFADFAVWDEDRLGVAPERCATFGSTRLCAAETRSGRLHDDTADGPGRVPLRRQDDRAESIAAGWALSHRCACQ